MSVQDIRMRLGRRIEASAAQAALSDREKVNLALRELLNITDPDAAALMRFAANQMVMHADMLLARKFRARWSDG